MATQEKLLKSLEALQNLITSNQILDVAARKKEKIQHCNFITEAMSNSTIKIAPNFANLLSFTIEAFLKLVDDSDSDVRMIADECLNRIVKAMNNNNIGKVQFELHKEIKKNGSARSLKAALVRFAQLAHLIRPHKGKAYVTNLVPCIIRISEREEEFIHETLATCLPHIMSALGCFTADNDVKALVRVFLNNIKNPSPVKRRAAANCILSVCLNSKKSFVFVFYVLNNLIDLLIPLQEDATSTSLILGVMGTLKLLLPCTQSKVIDEEIQGSFGVKVEVNEVSLEIERLLQVYELCIYYLCHTDHNVINAALETLNVLLQNIPNEMKTVLLSPSGLPKSYLFSKDGLALKHRSNSQLSVATHFMSEDAVPLESDLTDSLKPDIEKWIDESKLSVINIAYVRNDKNNEKQQSIDITDTSNSSFEAIESAEYSNLTIGTISDVVSEPSKSDDGLLNTFEKMAFSDTSSEKSSLQVVDDKSNFSIVDEDICDDVDIGEYTDKNVSLEYASRLIVKSFLLTGAQRGLISDKRVRVSVKNLALTCLSTIVQIHPKVLLLYLDKNCAKSGANQQFVADVFSLKEHADPQLRGAVALLTSSFVKAVLVLSNGNFEEWVEKNCEVQDASCFNIDLLLSYICKGLKDESSTCIRQSLAALSMCLKHLISFSCGFNSLMDIFKVLPSLSLNPYWLVKVKLLEVVCDIKYIQVHYVLGSGAFQDVVVEEILLLLLKDEDQRVRTACSKSIVRIIPNLYFPQDSCKESTLVNKAIQDKNHLLEMLDDRFVDTSLSKRAFVQNMPFPFCVIETLPCENVNGSLSRIVLMLHKHLLTTASKYLIFGCVETMGLLSTHYPPTVYFDAWSCYTNFLVKHESNLFQRSLSTGPMNASVQENVIESSSDLINICVNTLQFNVLIYDFNFHLNLLKLTGNLFAAKCYKNVKPGGDINLEDSKEFWDMFLDKNLSNLAEMFLTHVVKLLNIFSHIIDEIVPALPQIKTLPNLPSASNLSPLKRRKSDLGDKSKIISPIKSPEKEEKSEKRDVKINSMGCFVSSPHYMKLYELLKIAYGNYKVTLDVNASENFLNLVKTTLNTLSQILEIATLVETRRISEEVLQYLKAIFSLDPTSTVECVQQMLKSLFCCNLTSHISEMATPGSNKIDDVEKQIGFYGHIFQKPYSDLSKCIKNLHNVNKIDYDGDSTVMGYLHRSDNKKITLAKGSGTTLANYIKIFEPLVIKSLKQYTITSNIKLQGRVLQLLSQLVQLRVNYCLLDSEKIFIGHVLKQFDFIEEGQIMHSQDLIPKIFQFLVYLSYDKQHSKCIISVPKLIQLCDGLMASGQSPITHCIPALKPVVEDIFLIRNKSNTIDMKELETTREVLISMLLRLIEYKEVMDLFCMILNESKYCDNSELWYKWSKQIIDALIPKLKSNKIRIDSVDSFNGLKRLVFAINFEVFKPIDDIVVCLFQELPSTDDRLTVYSRWMGKLLILFLVFSQVKEEAFLAKVLETRLEFGFMCNDESMANTDPLNVTKITDCYDGLSPELIFNRFIFQTIDVYVEKVVDVIRNEESDFIIKEFTMFLINCLHIFQSGSHCKTAVTAINLINNEAELKKNRIDLGKINSNFLRISSHHPVLAFEWCYLLTLLNYNNINYWSSMMCLTELRNNNRLSMNLEIRKTGAVIVYCDFLSENLSNDRLSWFLKSNISAFVKFCNEVPIYELIGTMSRSPQASRLLLQSLTENFQNMAVDTKIKTNVLKSVENISATEVGNLVKFLTYNLLDSKELAMSRLVANLAGRKIEYLLTLKLEEVNSQLSKEDVLQMMKYLVNTKLSKKHERLTSLLNKLCAQFYDLTPIEYKQSKAVNPQQIKTLVVNKDWYLSQIRTKCENATVTKEIAELLVALEYTDLEDIMNDPGFSVQLLKECLVLANNDLKSAEMAEETHFVKAAVNHLLKRVSQLRKQLPSVHEVYNVDGRECTQREQIFTESMSQLLRKPDFVATLSHLIPTVSLYMNLRSSRSLHSISENNYYDLSYFAILCLELANFVVSVSTSLEINLLESAIRCAERCLKEPLFYHVFSAQGSISWLCSAVNSVYVVLKRFFLENHQPLPLATVACFKNAIVEDSETLIAQHACYQTVTLIAWLERNNASNCSQTLSRSLLAALKSIVVSLSRMPLLNSFALTPPSYFKLVEGVQLSGQLCTQVPPLPIKYLQEVDVLEEFIFRITLLGWTTRQQFEEMWMSLLSVLNTPPDEKLDQEELNNVTHTMSLAVRAITSLLMQTLYVPAAGNPNLSKLLHIPRDDNIEASSPSIKKLKRIQNHLVSQSRSYYSKCFAADVVTNVFDKSNTEKLDNNYSYGQLSLEYLLLASSNVDSNSRNEFVMNSIHARNKILQDSGLDVNSCLQFLLDLYSQWMSQQPAPPIRLLYEIVQSVLSISDLFTERSQYLWMLNSCLVLSRNHMLEDDIIHQYLSIAICKTAAVVTPEMEIYAAVQKIISQGLKSSFLPTRISALHGTLYMLQNCIYNNTVIGGVSEELLLYLPVIVQYIHCNLNESNGLLKQSEEHQLLLWSISFYLIENINEAHLDINFSAIVIQEAIEILKSEKTCNSLYSSFMKALERLIIKECLPQKLQDLITKFALEKMKNKNSVTALPAIQLLITCMYTESASQLESTEKSNGIVQSNPDNLVQTIEKVSAIFDRIKRGYPFEVEILCNILPTILNDFFPPSDILTKVIGEFLAPQQRHVKLLSRVVFRVFEKAIEQSQLSLLQDWVVFSLANFTQSLPLGMSTWCLTCFFISASTNKWLRSMFPYVQLRIGRYEYEDRKMLCITSSDFYNNLVTEHQKQTFVDTFNKVKDQIDTPFNDLLSSI